MIIIKTNRTYTSNKKHVQGAGFIDSLSSSLRNVGSYISQNKDLIFKPMLSATGDIAAFAMSEGGKSIVKKIANANNENDAGKNQQFQNTIANPKNNKLLQKLMNDSTSELTNIPTTNIIGSGIKTISTQF
jgi:hypothetical protein